MDKRVALITGANSGMGKATAVALARKGIHVVMLCRNRERGEQALREVQEKSGGSVSLMICDLGSMDEIRRFCCDFKNNYKRLDILVNNAGVITLKRQETRDGLELQFGVNHIGHFLLTVSLLNLIKDTGSARIVVVASGAHKIGRLDFQNIPLKRGYTVFSAYGRAKLCNILFTKELSRRLKNTRVTVNCVHPGAVATNMGVDRDTGFGKTIMKLLKPFFKTPEEGAATAVYVATSRKCRGVSGEYFYNKKIAGTARRANDEKLARKLWAVSEEIVWAGLKGIERNFSK